MFLSSMYDNSGFSFGLASENVPARKAAIEAELHHLPDFSGSNISVEISGACVLLEGVVENHIDFSRALSVATDIAGAEKVIFRVEVAPKISG